MVAKSPNVASATATRRQLRAAPRMTPIATTIQQMW
jgi:hypothetical protein